MINAWWIGLVVAMVGGVGAGIFLFGRHSSTPGGTGAVGSASAVMPGPGRRIGSALLLLVLTVGVAGLAAVAIGSVVFLGGLSLAN